MTPGVSVIICCYNSASRLSATIGHLLNQINTEAIDWEIIIVDNSSADNTFELASSILASGNIAYMVVKEPQPGLANARLQGYNVSKYEYLLYCDDDNHLASDYVAQVFKTMQDNERIGILGGMGEAIFEGQEPSWFQEYCKSFAVGDQSGASQALSTVGAVYGAGCTMRKVFLTRLYQSGFKSFLLGRTANNITSGDDIELCFMARWLGYEVWYHRGLKFKHLMASGRMNWSYLKKLFYGFGRMNIYVHAYKYVEENNCVPDDNLRLPLWLDVFIHKCRYLFNYYPKVMCKFGKEGDAEVLRFIAMRAEAGEVWRLKGNYLELYKSIYKYKTQIGKGPFSESD